MNIFLRRLGRGIHVPISLPLVVGCALWATLGMNISVAHAETKVTEGFLFTDTVWTASSSPYVIAADMTIPAGRTLTIGPGAVITADPELGYAPNIYSNGIIRMDGTREHPVLMTGVYGINTDHATTTVQYADIRTDGGLSFIGSVGSIASSTIRGVAQGIYVKTSIVDISASKITGNEYGVVVEPVPPIFQVRTDVPMRIPGGVDSVDGIGGMGNALEDASHVSISDSSLFGNSKAALRNTDVGIVEAAHNWWGSIDGPIMATTSTDPIEQNMRLAELASSTETSSSTSLIQNLRGIIVGPVVYEPWLDHDPLEEPATSTMCCSSVLFLPGIQGTWLSRVQQSLLGGTTTNTLWVPNRNDDVKKLFMDTTGLSTDPSIYSEGPIRTAFGLFSAYDSFMNSMDSLVHKGIINEWTSFGYDWRKPIAEVVAGPEKKATTTESLLGIINDLAARSRTGKVTLVAHSNGGLVAKYLTKVLMEKGEADLIDQVISVAVPNIGAPTAVGSILHGDYQEIAYGLFLKANIARQLAANMPSAYSLLPSQHYFSTTSAPTIMFASTSVTGVNTGVYPRKIDSIDSQSSFITDLFHERTQPIVTDISKPNIGNISLTDASRALHTVLDAFSWPTHIDQWSITGWNVETPRTLVYATTDRCGYVLWFSTGCAPVLSHSYVKTVFGDGTVPVASATYGAQKSVSIDLNQASHDKGSPVSHATILESTSTQSVIGSIIQHLMPQTGSRDTSGQTTSSSEPVRLEVRTMSDVDIDLHAYDSQNQHTGPIPPPNIVVDDTLLAYESQIPDSQFQPSNISLPGGGGSYTFVVRGAGIGSASLSFDKVRGADTITHIQYPDVPISPLTVATTTVVVRAESTSTSSSISVGVMHVDFDGDGTTDFVASSTADAYMSATSSIATSSSLWRPSLSLTLELYKKLVKTLVGTSTLRARLLIAQIERVQELVRRGIGPKVRPFPKGFERALGHRILKKMSQVDKDRIINSIEVLMYQTE